MSAPPDRHFARPWLVIVNDAGDYLAPGGVWTRDANRRFNFAEFSGRQLAEKLARLHSAKVTIINPDTWAARPEGDEKK